MPYYRVYINSPTGTATPVLPIAAFLFHQPCALQPSTASWA